MPVVAAGGNGAAIGREYGGRQLRSQEVEDLHATLSRPQVRVVVVGAGEDILSIGRKGNSVHRLELAEIVLQGIGAIGGGAQRGIALRSVLQVNGADRQQGR